MPIPALGSISGADITELIDSLEKQRKELEFVLSNLDTSNVSEFHADVINAGVINAKHISIGSETTYQTGYSPGDIRTEMETKFHVIDGEIAARVKQTDFNLLAGRVTTAEASLTVLPGQIELKASQTDLNLLTGRVATAESTLTVLPGQIASKVSQTDYNGNTIASLINQTAANITISASKIDLLGIVKVASVLNIGDFGVRNLNKQIIFGGSARLTNSANTDDLTISAEKVEFLANVIDFRNTTVTGLTVTAVWG